MNILKRLFGKKKSELRLSDLNSEVRDALLRGSYSVYIDTGMIRTWFGFLRMPGRKPRAYILDRQPGRVSLRLCP